MSSRMLSSGGVLGVAITCVVALSSEAARADDVSACVEAYDAAQVLRRAGTLVAAREKLLICGRATCPEVVQSSCTTWLDEVDRSMPTIVLHARGPGGDIVDVRVLVNGQVVRKSLDGRAVPIDPGVHTFRFQMSDDRVVETRVVVQEGVKNRLISVDFDEPVTGTPAPTQSERPVEQRGEPSPRAAEAVVDTGEARADVPTLAYVLGGVGVVGLGAFAAFGVSFDRQYKDLQACSPGCDAGDVDRASSTRTLALVSGGIGVVALGAAALVWLGTDGRAETSAPAAGVSVQVTPGAAMGAWTTRF